MNQLSILKSFLKDICAFAALGAVLSLDDVVYQWLVSLGHSHIAQVLHLCSYLFVILFMAITSFGMIDHVVELYHFAVPRLVKYAKSVIAFSLFIAKITNNVVNSCKLFFGKQMAKVSRWWPFMKSTKGISFLFGRNKVSQVQVSVPAPQVTDDSGKAKTNPCVVDNDSTIVVEVSVDSAPTSLDSGHVEDIVDSTKNASH